MIIMIIITKIDMIVVFDDFIVEHKCSSRIQ